MQRTFPLCLAGENTCLTVRSESILTQVLELVGVSLVQQKKKNRNV